MTSSEDRTAQARQMDHARVTTFLAPFKHGHQPWTQLDEADLVAFIHPLKGAL